MKNRQRFEPADDSTAMLDHPRVRADPDLNDLQKAFRRRPPETESNKVTFTPAGQNMARKMVLIERIKRQPTNRIIIPTHGMINQFADFGPSTRHLRR